METDDRSEKSVEYYFLYKVVMMVPLTLTGCTYIYVKKIQMTCHLDLFYLSVNQKSFRIFDYLLSICNNLVNLRKINN